MKALRSLRGGVRRGNGSVDRRSPASFGGSATNSPRKPSSAAQSDEEEDTSKKISDSTTPKVPPLKIVLSGSGQNSPTETNPDGGAPQETTAVKRRGGKNTGMASKDEANVDTNSNGSGSGDNKDSRVSQENGKILKFNLFVCL